MGMISQSLLQEHGIGVPEDIAVGGGAGKPPGKSSHKVAKNAK